MSHLDGVAVTKASPGMSPRILVACSAGVFILSLCVRLVCVWQAQHTPIADAKGYAQRAQHVVAHGALPRDAYRTPGYPYFLAGLYKCFGTDWHVPAMANAVIGAIVSVLLVLLAATCVDVRTATLAGLMHAVWLPTLAYIPQALSEHLAVVLAVAGLLFLALADKHVGWRSWLLNTSSAAVYGLLLLARPAALFLLPGWLFLVVYSPATRVWRPAVAGTFLLTTACVLAPWLIRNYQLGMGPLMLSSVGGRNLYVGNNDGAVSDRSMVVDASWAQLRAELGEAETDRWARRRAVEWIVAHPLRYASLCRVRALGLLGAEASGYGYLSLAHWCMPPNAFQAYLRDGPGFQNAGARQVHYQREYRRLQKQARRAIEWYYALFCPFALVSLVLAAVRWRRYAVLLLPTASYLVLLSLTYSQPRFREMSDPFLFVLVASLLLDIFCGTRQFGSKPGRAGKGILVAALLAAAIAIHASGISRGWYLLPPMGHG